MKTASELTAGDVIYRRNDDNVREVRLVRAVAWNHHAVWIMTTSPDRTDDDTTDVVTGDCVFTLETYGERLNRRGITNDYLRAERDGVVFVDTTSHDDPGHAANWATFLTWEASVTS